MDRTRKRPVVTGRIVLARAQTVSLVMLGSLVNMWPAIYWLAGFAIYSLCIPFGSSGGPLEHRDQGSGRGVPSAFLGPGYVQGPGI